MDVRLVFSTLKHFLTNRIALDHTKYVGKSSSDPVSKTSNIFWLNMTIFLQNNVKFSEDGEQVIEGNDVD